MLSPLGCNKVLATAAADAAIIRLGYNNEEEKDPIVVIFWANIIASRVGASPF